MRHQPARRRLDQRDTGEQRVLWPVSGGLIYLQDGVGKMGVGTLFSKSKPLYRKMTKKKSALYFTIHSQPRPPTDRDQARRRRSLPPPLSPRPPTLCTGGARRCTFQRGQSAREAGHYAHRCTRRPPAAPAGSANERMRRGWCAWLQAAAYAAPALRGGTRTHARGSRRNPRSRSAPSPRSEYSPAG
jgi:hypothetical protein